MTAKRIEKKEDNIKKTCFVIMPFSDPEGYEPGHFRSVYEYTFKPAIEAAGYSALRIDDNSVSNLIHGKMMNELVTAPMVLCDLSTNNPNVLYELGIRHAFDKPVVLVQEIGQNRIFDIAGITSVEYHRSRLYEEVLVDQKKITEAIRQTANAKTKYSIMSLVAIQAAKPADGESVSPEERVEYIFRDVSRKMDMLERRIIDMSQSGMERGHSDSFNFRREDSIAPLKGVIDETERYLELSEMMSDFATIEETQKYGMALNRKIRECQTAGVSSTYLDHAYRLLMKLDTLNSELHEKRK